MLAWNQIYYQLLELGTLFLQFFKPHCSVTPNTPYFFHRLREMAWLKHNLSKNAQIRIPVSVGGVELVNPPT